MLLHTIMREYHFFFNATFPKRNRQGERRLVTAMASIKHSWNSWNLMYKTRGRWTRTALLKQCSQYAIGKC